MAGKGFNGDAHKIEFQRSCCGSTFLHYSYTLATTWKLSTTLFAEQHHGGSRRGMLNRQELEDLRPWIGEEVERVIGFAEATIVNTAIDCIARKLSRQATTDQLSPYLEQRTDEFVMSLYRKVLEVKSSKLSSAVQKPLTTVGASQSKKRSLVDRHDSDDEEGGANIPRKKHSSMAVLSSRLKEDENKNGLGDSSDATKGSKTPIDIQAMLANTRKQIEERKKQTENILATQQKQASSTQEPSQGIKPSIAAALQEQKRIMMQQGLSTHTNVHPLAYHREIQLALGATAGPSALDQAMKNAEIQAKIKSQVASRPDLLKGLGAGNNPTPLILDKEGRTVDSSGKAVSITPRAPQFMVNLRAKQRASFKQATERKPESREERDATSSDYHDPRVSSLGSQRSRKQFKFIEPGKFIKQAQMERAKTQLEQLQSEIASVARKTGISSATKLALIAPTADSAEDVVSIEWWDATILGLKSYSDIDDTLPANRKYHEISNLVEHPITVQPPGEPTKPLTLPVMLTSKERKKLRRQRRREDEKEKQEKIQFGLIEKPEPKVRISNLMRVLGNEAVQDPTKVESYVRAQMAERQKKHEKANAERKLTPEERKAKKLKKMKEDLSCGVHVTVYRVKDMSNPALKFKVDMNAQQHHLTGCMLLYQDVNIIIVEGGPKSLKKYKRLMMHRIKWKPKGKGRADPDEEDEDSDDEGHSVSKKGCSIVWEGKVLDRAFNDWKVRYFHTENLARDHLKRHGVEHYWDLALSQSIVEQEGD